MESFCVDVTTGTKTAVLNNIYIKGCQTNSRLFWGEWALMLAYTH